MDAFMTGRRAVVASRSTPWRRALGDLLEELGAEAVPCKDLDRALAALAQGGVDLLVLDSAAARVVVPRIEAPLPDHVLVLDPTGSHPAPQLDATERVRPAVLHATVDSPSLVARLQAWFAAATSASGVVIDEAALSHLQATFGSRLQRVFDVFVSDSPDRATRLAAHVADENWADARREAHSLKSSTATFGLTALSGDLAAFEQACRRDEGPAFAHRVADIEGRLSAAIDGLRALLG